MLSSDHVISGVAQSPNVPLSGSVTEGRWIEGACGVAVTIAATAPVTQQNTPNGNLPQGVAIVGMCRPPPLPVSAGVVSCTKQGASTVAPHAEPPLPLGPVPA